MSYTMERADTEPRYTVAQRHARFVARIFRARMPYAMLAFLALTAAAAIPELSIHPDRAPVYVVVYALEAQVWLLALILTRSAPLAYARAVTIAMATTLGMMTLMTGYHVYAGAEAHALLISLAYVTVGAMLVFPWRARAQVVVAAASVVAYAIGLSIGVPVTSEVGVQVVGLVTIAATTVATVCMIDQYRSRLLQTAGSSYMWRRTA